MRNRTFHFLAVFLMVFAVSCQNTGKDSNASQDDEQSKEIQASVKAELEAIRDKSNDLMERISNATYAERQNLQDDVAYFVSETKETLTEMETDSELEQGVEEMVHNLRENTNLLVEEAKKFSTQTEAQWEEATTNLENKMKEISGEIEAFFSD
jgi:hypothetical protein